MFCIFTKYYIKSFLRLYLVKNAISDIDVLPLNTSTLLILLKRIF